MSLVDSIISASKAQNATCMYSREELETFSVEKLNNIFLGILELAKRPPWRKSRKGPPAISRRKKKAK